MAHFAHLDSTNNVINVEVVNNEVITDINGNEQEQLGIDFLTQLHNSDGRYKQTSYNNSFRKNFAGIGYKYDTDRDAFISPQPYNSWLLDGTTCWWYSPVPYPTDDLIYTWDEATTSWVETT
jgi:hypothetical protein